MTRQSALLMFSVFAFGWIAWAGAAGAQTAYELWVLDQGANALLIYDGAKLNAKAQPERVDLAPLGGTKPHMVLFSPKHDYALIANVASGHVYIMRASDRKVVFNEDLGQQAHAALPSPDGARALVANQNDKKVTEIVTDYGKGAFKLGRALDLEQAPELADAVEFPDRAPICLMFTADSSKAYVTLRGGGIAVVVFPADQAAPAKVTKAFGKVRDGIEANGCGTLRSADGTRMYANSGSESGGKFYVFDASKDALIGSTALTETGRDAHGVALAGRHVWVANRSDDNVAVLSAEGKVVGKIDGVGDAPDLLDVSPGGDRMFVTLRGPKPATGTHDMAGKTPGVSVLSVQDGGKSAKREFIIPIGDQSAESPNDPHGIAVRKKG
ncbi:MAG: YncE family protein [Nitrospirota bacterium]